MVLCLAAFWVTRVPCPLQKRCLCFNVSLSVNDLVACQKIAPISFPNEMPDIFALYTNISPTEPDIDKNSMSLL